MRHISLIMPYYNNPGMLAIHYDYLSKIPGEIKSQIDVVIVDDGSFVKPAIDVERPEGLPSLTIFQVLVDKPWHQHAARNIGAYHAEGPWILLTDMDHLVPVQTWTDLLARQNRGKIYTFTRVDAPDMTPKLHPKTGLPHSHPNSFCLTKELYWDVGGYDEDFCGVYGTDGLFRSRLFSKAKEVKLNSPLVRYSREVQDDAATNTLPRKEGRDPLAKKRIREEKALAGTTNIPTVMSMPYRKVFPC